MTHTKRLALFLSVVVILKFLIFFSQAEATRVFESNSTWYTEIPSSPVLDSKSDTWVNYFKTWGGLQSSCGFGINTNNWSNPLYYADQNTPLKEITAGSYIMKVPWESTWRTCDEEEECQCSYRDGQAVIVDTHGFDPTTGSPDGKPKVWSITQARNCVADTGNTGACPSPSGLSNDNTYFGWGFWQLKSGNGITKCGTSDGTWGGYRGASRVSCVTTAHGFITYEEANGPGEINHALALGGPQSKRVTGYPDNWVYPSPDCCNNWGAEVSYNTDTPNVPPLGIRFQLNVSASFCDAISNSLRKKICHAFRKYGGIFVEHTDSYGYATVICAEDLTHSQYGYSWSGLSGASPPSSWWDYMRVVLPVCSGTECDVVYNNGPATCSGENQNANCLSAGSNAPTLPSDTTVTVTVGGSTRLNLTWNAASDVDNDLAGYKIERCLGGGCTGFTQIDTSAYPSYIDNGLSANTFYRYRIRAYDYAGNNSSYYTIGEGTTSSPPSQASKVYNNLKLGVGDSITIDGNCNEQAWKWANPINTTDPVTGTRSTIKFRWDDTAFYFCVKCYDKYLNAVITTHDSDEYLDDGIYVMFDMDRSKGTSQDSDDYGFVVNIYGYTAETKASTFSAWNPTITNSIHYVGTIDNNNDVDNNYTIEGKITWADWGISAPSLNTTIGFDVQMTDFMWIPPYQNYVTWCNSNGGSATDPDGWGDMVFVDAPPSQPSGMILEGGGTLIIQ